MTSHVTMYHIGSGHHVEHAMISLSFLSNLSMLVLQEYSRSQ